MCCSVIAVILADSRTLCEQQRKMFSDDPYMCWETRIKINATRLDFRHAATKGQTSGSKTDRVESTFNSWEDANAVPSAFVPAQLCLSSLVPDVQSYMDQVCMEHLWQEYPNFPPPRQDNGRNKA